jgi:hypothetical protein
LTDFRKAAIVLLSYPMDPILTRSETGKQDNKNLFMELPGSFLKHLRVEAAKRDLTMKALLVEAVTAYIGSPVEGEAAQ